MKNQRFKNDDYVRGEDFGSDFPVYHKETDSTFTEPVEVDLEEKPKHVLGEIKPEDPEEGKKASEDVPSDEDMNVSATPKYTSYAQIKKELVILDLERKIAWEELISVKHDIKEDLDPANFVEPALKGIGIISGIVILKNLIFGR